MENCKDLKSSILAIFIDKLNVKKRKNLAISILTVLLALLDSFENR